MHGLIHYLHLNIRVKIFAFKMLNTLYKYLKKNQILLKCCFRLYITGNSLISVSYLILCIIGHYFTCLFNNSYFIYATTLLFLKTKFKFLKVS